MEEVFDGAWILCSCHGVQYTQAISTISSLLAGHEHTRYEPSIMTIRDLSHR
jgi:hypothetical protein